MNVITINPQNPSAGQSVALGFNWSGCQSEPQTLSLDGNEFTYTNYLSLYCGTPPGGYFEWDVGELLPGPYTVIYQTSTRQLDNSVEIETIDSTAFTVSGAGGDFHGVPMLPPLGVVPLVFGLLFFAYKRL